MRFRIFFEQQRDNSPIFLKYPNYLADESYNAYSGYEWYYAAEIYGQFGDGCEARREKGFFDVFQPKMTCNSQRGQES